MVSDQKWNSFPHLTSAELDDADRLPVSDASQTVGSRDATTTIGELKALFAPTSTTITVVEALTQAEYDLLTPDAGTLYVITDA